MKLTGEPITLNLMTTFRIAHGADDQRHNVIACIEQDGITGLGEAPGVVYHGETQAGILAYLESVAPLIGDDPFLLESTLRRMPSGSRAARSAVDTALHDLWGKLIGQPLHRLFGLDPTQIPLTSFTIPMDEPQRMAERASQSGYPIIKVKVGGDQDEAVIKAIREATNARLRLDANAGWGREQALRIIPHLMDYDIELIEQPLPAADLEGLIWLRQQLRSQGIRVPIFADESVKSAQDVVAHRDAVDGVVIKLAKTGGLREAMRAIAVARALEKQVMISCMVETTLGVTAAAHIAPLCDYVDLDGPLLIRDDPFEGLRYHGAQLILPTAPGLGVARKQASVSAPA